MNEFDIFKDHWGDIASVTGLGVATIAAFFAKGAKKASKEAKQAVTTAIAGQEIEKVIALVDRVKDWVREERWREALIGSEMVRARSISFITMMGVLPEPEQTDMAIHLEKLRLIIRNLDRGISDGSPPPNRRTFNNQLDDLGETLLAVSSKATIKDAKSGGRKWLIFTN